jgi:hypothetical protein
MNLLPRLRPSAVTAACLLIASLVIPVAASAGRPAHNRCNAAAGRTLLKDASTRVYTTRGRVHGCLRPGGASHGVSVFPRAYPDVQQPVGLKLSGRFLAFSQMADGDGAYGVFDARTGRARLVTETSKPGRLLGFVVNSHGTVVWLEEGASNCGCYAPETLTESWAHGTSVLENVANGSGDRNISVEDPIPAGSLGLNASGTTAHWITNGKPRSARIR